MSNENILNINPENLMQDACDLFDKDPELKKEYEKKWDTEVECIN